MVQISDEPSEIVKHYSVKVISYTTYNQTLIHNETTGAIEMTNNGMSVNSYREYINTVLMLFGEKMGLKVERLTFSQRQADLIEEDETKLLKKRFYNGIEFTDRHSVDDMQNPFGDARAVYVGVVHESRIKYS